MQFLFLAEYCLVNTNRLILSWIGLAISLTLMLSDVIPYRWSPYIDGHKKMMATNHDTDGHRMDGDGYSNGMRCERVRWGTDLISLLIYIPRVYLRPMLNIADLKWLLTAAWSGLQQHVIDEAIEQQRGRLHVCVRTDGRHLKHCSCSTLQPDPRTLRLRRFKSDRREISQECP